MQVFRAASAIELKAQGEALRTLGLITLGIPPEE